MMYISKMKCMKCEKKLTFKDEEECKRFINDTNLEEELEFVAALCEECGGELFDQYRKKLN